jgi:hypothetical protein
VSSTPRTGSQPADLSSDYRCPAATRRHTPWSQAEYIMA